MAALELLELVSGLADFWLWFSLTGSCVVWVVTLGRVWLVDDHPHWAALIGIMLHLAVLVVVAVFFWGSGSGEKVTPDSARTESRPAQKSA